MYIMQIPAARRASAASAAAVLVATAAALGASLAAGAEPAAVGVPAPAVGVSGHPTAGAAPAHVVCSDCKAAQDVLGQLSELKLLAALEAAPRGHVTV